MSTTLEQNQYGFDRNSRRTWQKRPLTYTQDQQYNYDALSQVSAAARGSLNLNTTAISGIPAKAEIWDYDPTGNWRGYHSAAAGATPLDQHRVHDRGNRLTQIENNPNNMVLDRAGRMLQLAPDASGDWDGKLELTWDAWSRITSVKNNGTEVGSYGYDGTHRRTTREVDSTTLHSYYNDAWRPVEERRDVETTASASYLWGARHRDDLVRRDRATSGTTFDETRYILMDYYNPSAITDETGAVKERYAFSVFGLRTIMNADYTVRSDSECGMEFAFQGPFLDVESGLMNYGYRYYSAYLGRWTCKDPIAENGGLNLYAACFNSALNKVDLFGLLDKEGGAKSIRESLPSLKKECDECCPLGTIAECKTDAEKIVEGLAQSWENAYGNGKQTHRHAVGGYFCWHWANRFNNVVKKINSTTWDNELAAVRQSKAQPGEPAPIVHVWMKITIKSKRANAEGSCTGFSYDDSYFGEESCFHDNDNWPKVPTYDTPVSNPGDRYRHED